MDPFLENVISKPVYVTPLESLTIKPGEERTIQVITVLGKNDDENYRSDPGKTFRCSPILDRQVANEKPFEGGFLLPGLHPDLKKLTRSERDILLNHTRAGLVVSPTISGSMYGDYFSCVANTGKRSIKLKVTTKIAIGVFCNSVKITKCKGLLNSLKTQIGSLTEENKRLRSQAATNQCVERDLASERGREKQAMKSELCAQKDENDTLRRKLLETKDALRHYVNDWKAAVNDLTSLQEQTSPKRMSSKTTQTTIAPGSSKVPKTQLVKVRKYTRCAKSTQTQITAVKTNGSQTAEPKHPSIHVAATQTTGDNMATQTTQTEICSASKTCDSLLAQESNDSQVPPNMSFCAYVATGTAPPANSNPRPVHRPKSRRYAPARCRFLCKDSHFTANCPTHRILEMSQVMYLWYLGKSNPNFYDLLVSKGHDGPAVFWSKTRSRAFQNHKREVQTAYCHFCQQEGHWSSTCPTADVRTTSIDVWLRKLRENNKPLYDKLSTGNALISYFKKCLHYASTSIIR